MEQLREIDVAATAIMLEPAVRNTAPAVAAAALMALEQCAEGEEPVLLVLPSDHVVQQPKRFAIAAQTALSEAAAGKLVTFGVVPTRAETGYGYIKAGSLTEVGSGARIVESFIEKPCAERAAAFLEAGNHYWNSGMFVFGASQYLDELETYAPVVRDCVQQAYEKLTLNLGLQRLDSQCFLKSPSLSVDHAIMERTANAVMVPLDAGWSDVGSWTTLAELGETDDAGNAVQGDAMLQNTSGTLVYSRNRLVAAVGMQDCVIVDSADALLVASKNSVQDIKQVVEHLKQEGREEAISHRKVHRPWGTYDSVHEGPGYKVKHIVVKPQARLSLQMHHHRSEHWVVLHGEARVTCGDEILALFENQSTYIPQGFKHSLENPGDVPLEIIEVQVGDRVDEDDIVRLEDVYERVDGTSS